LTLDEIAKYYLRKKILEGICVKHGVSLEMLEQLLSVEKEYQLKERR